VGGWRRLLEPVSRLQHPEPDRQAGRSALLPENGIGVIVRGALAHPAVPTAIPGIKDPAQAAANIAASEMDIAPDRIDEIVPFGGGRKIWPA